MTSLQQVPRCVTMLQLAPPANLAPGPVASAGMGELTLLVQQHVQRCSLHLLHA
jgi:hypothetical protein